MEIFEMIENGECQNQFKGWQRQTQEDTIPPSALFTC